MEQAAPGAVVLRTWQLSGGVSSRPTAVEVRLPDGERRALALRRHRNAAAEFRVLELLSGAGLPVPRPCVLAEPYVVTELLAGTPWPVEPAPDGVPLLARQLARIHAVDASAAELRTLDGAVNEPVLLHGDYWPGNALWRDGRPIAVVDWEDAARGDPLVDVANCRLELLWALGRVAVDEFTAAYRAAAPRVSFERLPSWDVFTVDRLLPALPSWGLDDAVAAEYRRLAEAFRADARQRGA